MLKLVNNKDGADKIRHLTSLVTYHSDSSKSEDSDSSKSEDSEFRESEILAIANSKDIEPRKDGRPRRNLIR
jgi:hypothetical protein